MKITITGSLGNISKPLALHLIKAGHSVTVISSNPERKEAIEALGAHAAIGNIKDEHFLINAFNGADAVYTMIPPNLQSTDFLKYATSIAEQYAHAIRKTGVKRIVNLSSIGADQDGGIGPIIGNRASESILNRIEGAAITHIRGSFFYTNFYGNIEMIRNLGILGSNYSGSSRLIMVHPEDIAVAVGEELQSNVNGIKIRYVASDDRNAQEAATQLGTAVGIPGLPWVEFPDDQLKDALLNAGFTGEMAGLFVEMGQAVRSGKLWTDYDAHHNQPTGKIKLENFAREFAAGYSGALTGAHA